MTVAWGNHHQKRSTKCEDPVNAIGQEQLLDYILYLLCMVYDSYLQRSSLHRGLVYSQPADIAADSSQPCGNLPLQLFHGDIHILLLRANTVYTVWRLLWILVVYSPCGVCSQYQHGKTYKHKWFQWCLFSTMLEALMQIIMYNDNIHSMVSASWHWCIMTYTCAIPPIHIDHTSNTPWPWLQYTYECLNLSCHCKKRSV